MKTALAGPVPPQPHLAGEGTEAQRTPAGTQGVPCPRRGS